MDKLYLVGEANSFNKKGTLIEYKIYVGIIDLINVNKFLDKVKNSNDNMFDDILNFNDFLGNENKDELKDKYTFHIITLYQKNLSIKLPTFIKSGKNIGKKNETNIISQVLSEAKSKYQKYLNKNAVTDLYPPMLASKFSEGSILESVDIDNIKIDKVYFAELKYDGNRAVTYFPKEKNPFTYSRERHEIFVHEKLYDDLKKLGEYIFQKKENLKDYYLDGELYLHDVPLQEITGQVRKQKREEITMEYNYNLFDIFNPKIPDEIYSERKEKLRDLLSNFSSKYIKYVDYLKIDNSLELKQYYTDALVNKYEGLVLKDPNGIYEYSYKGYHSNFMKKLKPSTRQEYPIVGYETGKGKNIKSITIILLNKKTNKEFKCTLKAPIEEKEKLNKLWSTDDYFKKNIYGILATVEFQDKSEDDIPLRGVIIEILYP